VVNLNEPPVIRVPSADPLGHLDSVKYTTAVRLSPQATGPPPRTTLRREEHGRSDVPPPIPRQPTPQGLPEQRQGRFSDASAKAQGCQIPQRSLDRSHSRRSPASTLIVRGSSSKWAQTLRDHGGFLHVAVAVSIEAPERQPSLQIVLYGAVHPLAYRRKRRNRRPSREAGQSTAIESTSRAPPYPVDSGPRGRYTNAPSFLRSITSRNVRAKIRRGSGATH
jgi:hypothetical protein